MPFYPVEGPPGVMGAYGRDEHGRWRVWTGSGWVYASDVEQAEFEAARARAVAAGVTLPDTDREERKP